MAYFSLHAYDADVWVQEFRGLNQADDGPNQDIRYAAEEENLETIQGTLQPRAAITAMPESFEDPIETLSWFWRRWYTGPGSKGWMVAASGGKLFYKQMHQRTPWVQIELPTGIESFQSNHWSWVTYEINPEGSQNTVDVLVMTNALDGMIMVIPPDTPYLWLSAKSHTWQYHKDNGTWEDFLSAKWTSDPIQVTSNDYKLGVIERSHERIWGSAIVDEPDMLVYSATYDPTNWNPNVEIPEDGSGSIQQPTWDGDSFTALRAFGDQLLAFKEHRVWRIQGTNPGEFMFTEQFGGGTAYPDTIVSGIERVYMMNDEGIQVYDGQSVNPYIKDQIRKIWQTVNKDALTQACAVIHERKYYLAFPTGESEVNNALLIVDFEQNTILYHTGIYIESLLSTRDGLLATSSTEPGKVLEIGYDSWTKGAADGCATRWASPWMDFGYKRIVKGGFELYFNGQVQDTAVPIKFSIQTEKKLKTKTYTVQPLTTEQQEANKSHKYKRLHFSGTGRKFRVIIETEEGVTAPWRLIGGLQLVVETDPD